MRTDIDAAWSLRYQDFVERHPSRSVYHTDAWRRAIQYTYGYTPCYVTAQNAAGRIVGLMPLFEVQSLVRGRHLTAIPFSHHVEALYESEEALQALVSRAQQIARQRKCKYIEARGSAQALARLGFQVSAHNWISQLELRAEEKTLGDHLHSSTRRNVRKAQKNGLTVRRGADAADFAAFYQLVLETRRHQGSPPYPARLFTALQAMDQARLYLACRREQILAGIIILCYGTYVIYAYGASVKDLEALRMRPNDLLFWRVISEVQAKGYRTFDFGSTPKNDAGLLRYKENWGAQSEPLAYAYWLNTTDRIPVVRRERGWAALASKAIRRMPLWAVRLLGEQLFKELG